MAVPCRAWEFCVVCDLALGETACVVGSVPQLGSWQLDGAVELQAAGPPCSNYTGNGTRHEALGSAGTTPSVSKVTVTLRADQDVEYRYCVCVVLNMDGGRKMVIRRWETEMAPRKVTVAVLRDEAACSQLDEFGRITPARHIDRGWLNDECVVQLKLYNNPVELWKRRQRKYRLKVTPVDLEKKMLLEVQLMEEDSSEMDSQSLRQPKSWPIMEIAAMVDGETSFQQQEQFGREYHKDAFLTFQCQMFRPDTIAYMVDLYSATITEDGTSEHIGFSHILPKNLKRTNGVITIPITGCSHQPIGQLTVEYLVVRPMSETKCRMEGSFSRYWHTTWRGLDVGHRGAGSSFTQKPEVCANVRENTIASLKQAAQHGADFVEFDIQLSKDLTPLIYHDFHVDIALRKKDVVNSHHLLTVPLKDLEHSQLRQLQVYNIQENMMGSHHLENDSQEDNQPFPALQVALETLPPHVGFNIEIKWTMQLQDGSFELYHPFELNSYIDNILKVVLIHSGTRKIIFSCFNPDICTMLRLKQNRYPVLFLSQGETSQWPPYLDSRTQTLKMSLLFAQSAQILGVSVFSGLLLQQPEFIQQAQAKGLVVFCWGDDNANVETIRYLKARGCNAIIYDRMDKYCTKDNKESIFLMEKRQARHMSLGEELSDGSESSEPSTEMCTSTASRKCASPADDDVDNDDDDAADS